MKFIVVYLNREVFTSSPTELPKCSSILESIVEKFATSSGSVEIPLADNSILVIPPTALPTIMFTVAEVVE